MNATDLVDPGLVTIISLWRSEDGGQSWLPHGSATRSGATTANQSVFSVPAPPEGVLVKGRIQVGGRAVRCGYTVEAL